MYNELCGASRRVQALIRRGFTIAQIAQASCVADSVLRNLAHLPTSVGRSDFARIVTAYDVMELDDPPAGTRATAIHTRAKVGEWIAPELWAGYDMDDPYVIPPKALPLTVADYRIIRNYLLAGNIRAIDATLKGREGEIPGLVGWLVDQGMPLGTCGLICAVEGLDPKRRGEYFLGEYRKLKAGRRPAPDNALVLFTGSRRVEGYHAPFIWRMLVSAVRGGRPGALYALMEGGAGGADTVARNVAQHMLRWPVLTRPADWKGPCHLGEDANPRCNPSPSHRSYRAGDRESYCPLAGHRRNQRMVDEAVHLSEIHDGLEVVCRGVYRGWESKGTGDCLRRARKAGIHTRVRTVEKTLRVGRCTSRSSKETPVSMTTRGAGKTATEAG